MAYKYAKPLIKGFFKLDIMSWSIATLCGVGLIGKFIDRYPANFRKANGAPLPDDIYAIFQLVEMVLNLASVLVHIFHIRLQLLFIVEAGTLFLGLLFQPPPVIVMLTVIKSLKRIV